MTQTLTPPSIEPVPADPAAAPVVPVSSLLVATAFVHRGLAWWARFVLSIGHVNPSLTLDRLDMIHVAEWSTVRVRVKKRRPKRPLLVFVANHNAGADDYIASFALFLKSRINRAFGNNRDWQSITTTRLLTDYVVDHEQTVMCSYWAYPGATVTDIVVALNARRLWERLPPPSGRRRRVGLLAGVG